jgi:hypothetical protein
MVEMQVNYWAVLVTGIVLFMLGGLWYSPVLFGKRWTGLIDRTEEQLKKASTPATFAVVFIAELLTAFVLALVVNWAGVTDAAGGALVGFLCWLGLAGATSLMTYLLSARPVGLWAIDSGYTLASFLIAGIILGIWR